MAASLERQLLALEGRHDGGFLEACCHLLGADHGLLVARQPSGAPRLAASTGLSPAARKRLRAALPVLADHPLVAELCGTCRLVTQDLEALPLGTVCADAAWALAAVGEGCAYLGLFFGRGNPPQALAEDPLLAATLRRRLGEQLTSPAVYGPEAAEALARLSHEFKTPLVSIKGYAELLLDQADDPLSPRSRDRVRRIAGGANRLAALFRKVTAEARAEGNAAYDPQPVTPGSWVSWCVNEARALALARDLTWAVRVPAEVGPVLVDPEAGRDALLELLQNAARATPDGGRICVTAAADEREGQDGVSVTVADTGVGVPADADAERLFERFVTLGDLLGHHSGDFEYGAAGMGLGLALVRGVARAHGGSVWVEGRGRDPEALPGAVFGLWLPAAPVSAAPAGAVVGSSPGGRLLLLDPDAEARGILTSALGDHYRVVGAAEPAEALRLWKGQGPWDACLVEPHGSEGGGVGLLRELRAAAGEEAVILAYTAAGAPAQAQTWRLAGADGCISKPARARQLLQRLATLKSRKARR